MCWKPQLAAVLLALTLSMHGQVTLAGPTSLTGAVLNGPSYITTKPHGVFSLGPGIVSTFCQTGAGSLWQTDLQPTFFPASVRTYIKGLGYQLPWNKIQTGINTYSFATFNTNCPLAQLGYASSFVVFQNEATGGATVNDFLPLWYNSGVGLAVATSCTRSAANTGSCVTLTTTPAFTTGDVFCVDGTALGVGSTSFNHCGYTSTGIVTTNGSNFSTISWTDTAGGAASDSAIGGFAQDVTGTAYGGSNCGGQTGVVCAGLVVSTMSRSGTCPGATCVVTVTLTGNSGSPLNTIVPNISDLRYGNGDQIMVIGSHLTGTTAFDGVWLLCDVATKITGCINPTASSFTFLQSTAANNTDTATGGFVGNPIISDPNCHPHTQAVKWIPNFFNAWGNYIHQVKINEDSLGFGYFRIADGIGGEMRINNSYNVAQCRTDLLSDAATQTPLSDTFWQQQVISQFDVYIRNQQFVTPMDESISVLQVNDFANADQMAATHVANGFGFGTQGLSNSGVTNWNTGSAPVHTGIDNDWTFTFPLYYPQAWLEVQLVQQDDATGASNGVAGQVGQLPLVLGDPLGVHAQDFECFFQTCLSTWDSSWCPWNVGTCTTPSTNFANFMGGSLITCASCATVAGSALTSSSAIFSTAWPSGMAVAIGGTKTTPTETALISSCASTTACTLQSSPGNLTSVAFFTYNLSYTLAQFANYQPYLNGIVTQLN